MKMILLNPVLLSITILGVLLSQEVCYGQLSPGQVAPGFSLKDLRGQPHDLMQLKERAVTVLYFFDAESRPSQEGMLSLNQLAKGHKPGDLTIWGITLSPREKVSKFISSTSLGFPVLIDDSKVSDQYHARLILPTVSILGPGLKVLHFFQGGGKATEVMLVRFVEKQLQEKVKIGFLKVESTPEGAHIFVNGALKGRSPVKLDLPLGKHEIRLTLAEHYEWEAQIQLTQEGEVPLQIHLTPIVEKKP